MILKDIHTHTITRRILAALILVIMVATVTGQVSAVTSRSNVTQPAKYGDHYAFYGIDVSMWQGNIDWNAIKSAGADYAFIRAGATSQSSFSLDADSKFDENMANAAAAGVARGVYWYSQATTEEEAIEEAKRVCSMADGKNIELPIVMDLEYSGGRFDSVCASWRASGGNAYAQERLTSVCRAFLDYCKSQGYTTCLYAAPNITNSYGVDANAIVQDGSQLWLAMYTSGNNVDLPFSYWQFSSTDRIDGIRGNVDSDYMYVSKTADKAGHPDVTAKIDFQTIRHTGQAEQPSVSVTGQGGALQENVDYTVAYFNNIQKGTAYALVMGRGEYAGYTECLPFTIGEEDIVNDPEKEPSNVITTKDEDGNTVVQFSGAKAGDVEDYRIAYKMTADSEWQYVTTGGKTTYTLEGEPVEIKVSSVNEDAVIGSQAADNSRKSDVIDQMVKEETSLALDQRSRAEKVRKINEEVSSGVALDF